MRCDARNQYAAVDETYRPIQCTRPAGHTRWHKGRGRMWTPRFTVWTYKKRKGL